MSTELPARPHLDVLRRQARTLLRALIAGDPAALARAAPYALGTHPKLSGAQLVIAREHGLTNWPRLVAEVDRRQAAALADDAFVDQVLTLALGRGFEAPQPARALALIHSRPLDSLPLALVCGDLAAVQRALAGADLHAAIGPFAAPPIAHVAFSSLARLDDVRPRLLATLRWLLDQGADANATLRDPADPDAALPLLYGAVAQARCFDAVDMLLRAGAEPNDNESLYHATEQRDRRMLDALVAAGARWTGTNALLRQLDHDDLGNLRQALDLGADPNERGPGGRTALHHALLRGRSADFVQLLLERGADPHVRDDDGHAAAWHAARAGDRASLALIEARGAGLGASAAEAFIAACAAADEAAARAHLAAHPDALARLDADGLRLLPDQAQRGHAESVALMLALGWPVATRGDWDASALNQAAFRGDAAMVQVLMNHGARWDEPNGFGGDVLGSCLHAACHAMHPEGDHAAVLALLLAQGAPVPTELDALPEPLQEVVLARGGDTASSSPGP